uniref:Glycosyl transferase 64 domain-containing protein n=1 Tax=Phaeodactylum tricornutum TaxID=2850 RepID=A0A8J9SXQ3_PHATR
MENVRSRGSKAMIHEDSSGDLDALDESSRCENGVFFKPSFTVEPSAFSSSSSSLSTSSIPPFRRSLLSMSSDSRQDPRSVSAGKLRRRVESSPSPEPIVCNGIAIGLDLSTDFGAEGRVLERSPADDDYSPKENSTNALGVSGFLSATHKSWRQHRRSLTRLHAIGMLSLGLVALLGVLAGVAAPQVRTRKLLGGRAPSPRESRRVLRQIESGTTGKASVLTVRLHGHRIDLIQRSLDQHARCNVVAEAQIDWSDRNLPDSLLNHFSNKVSPVQDVPDGAVLFLDESVLLSCAEIERALGEWRQDPTRLVGFSTLQVAYGPSVLVSSRAVVAHNLYVDNFKTHTHFQADVCDHLVLSARVAAISGKSPVVVAAHPRVVAQTMSAPVVSTKTSTDDEVYDSSDELQHSSADARCVSRLLKAVGLTTLPADPEGAGITYIGRT